MGLWFAHKCLDQKIVTMALQLTCDCEQQCCGMHAAFHGGYTLAFNVPIEFSTVDRLKLERAASTSTALSLVYVVVFFSASCTFHDIIPICRYVFGYDHHMHMTS